MYFRIFCRGKTPHKPLFSVLWKIFHSKVIHCMSLCILIYVQGQYVSENEQTQNEIYILFM